MTTPEPTSAADQPRAKRRRDNQSREVHHHHHYHERPRKPREIDMSGDPYGVVKARVNRRYLKAGVAVCVAGLLAVLAFEAYAFSRGEFSWEPIAVVGVIAVVIGAMIAAHAEFNEDDYYSVQGSRFADGGHRCVHCGHGGIWRHSPYRTNHTLADCSNKACGLTLWREAKG